MRVDFDERQIGLVIAGDVMSVVRFAVIRRHVNFQIGGTLDHVLVSNDVTSWIDNETGAEALQSLADFARPDSVISEELRVKILKRITYRFPDDALGVNIYYCRQNLCHGENSRFRSRVGLS